MKKNYFEPEMKIKAFSAAVQLTESGLTNEENIKQSNNGVSWTTQTISWTALNGANS